MRCIRRAACVRPRGGVRHEARGTARDFPTCVLAPVLMSCDPFVYSGSAYCWDGVVEGDFVEIELVEPYVEGGAYRWAGVGGPRPPSCAGVDGLQTGDRIRFRVERAFGTDVSRCYSHRGIPVDTVTNVNFEGARGEASGATWDAGNPMESAGTASGSSTRGAFRANKTATHSVSCLCTASIHPSASIVGSMAAVARTTGSA